MRCGFIRLTLGMRQEKIAACLLTLVMLTPLMACFPWHRLVSCADLVDVLTSIQDLDSKHTRVSIDWLAWSRSGKSTNCRFFGMHKVTDEVWVETTADNSKAAHLEYAVVDAGEKTASHLDA